MAKTRAQREAEERLRKNNERIYRETGYDPDGWRERTAEIARTERNFAQPSRPKKQKNFTYLKNTKRNAQDRERNIDPYAWQNRDYGTQEDDGFRWDFGLTGLFGMLAEKKKREEEKADKADPTKSGQYTQAKQEIMKPFEEKVSSAEKEEEAARKKADTLENLIFTKAKGYGTGAGQGYAAAQSNVFASEEEKTENAARLTSALAGQSGKTQEAEQKAADAKGKGAATAAAKALRDQAEKQVDKEIYTIDIQNDTKREEYTQKGREADSKLKKELSKEYVDRVREFGFNADDSKLAYYLISEEEADTYFALNGKYGEEVANRYLNSLMPELEERAAQEIYESVEGLDNEALKKIARLGVTVEGAGQNVRRNFMNLPASVTGSDEVTAPGVFQQARGKIGENLEGVEKVVNDAADSLVNMAPSLALGFIPGAGPAAAAGMTGATSYSNAYTDAILSGYEPGQAAAYALPSAASEALMQYAIGGVAKMGGSKSLTNTVQKAMDDVIKNPAARNVLGKAAQAGGEALEEYLQANLDPVLRNLALGENNEIDPVSEDKAYAALLGAVMGGAIDAAGDVANIPARRSAQRAQDAAYVRQGVHEALNDPIVEQEVRIPTRREAGALDVTDAGNRIRYEQEIDGVFNGELPTHEEIIMGRTPELLTLYGAPDLPLHMTQATARKIAYPEGYQGGRHNLGIQALKELPEQLSDPVAILESKTQPDSHVVLTEWNDTNGDRVIVPIHFNKNGALKINTNEIVSAYGKGNISALMGKNNENVIYTRNNENIADLLAHGLQLPEPQVSNDFSTYNIPRSGNGVNRQYSAKMNADEMLDRIGTQRAYNPSETVKLASGAEAVVVARDGGSYVVQEPGKQGYSRVSADSIIGKVQSASPQADRSIAPEARAALNEKYDHRHVEKLADQAFLDKLEQGRGIKAVIEDMQPGAEAFYDRSTNTIHFAPDSTRADVIGGVAAHELSHAAEASEHYKAYSDYAVQRLFGNDAEALQQAIEAKQEQYVQHGVYLSDADAVSEIVADHTRNLYKSPADIDALVTGNRGMAQSIYDAIRTAIQKIRAFFKGDEAALRNIREYQDLRRAQRLFERALSTIPEVQAETAPAYALNPNFESEIDAWDGVSDMDFEIGTPSSPLLELGVKDNKIIWKSGKINEILLDHPEMNLDIIKQTPQVLENPVMILKSKKVSPKNKGEASRLVLFGEVYDTEGVPVLAALEIRPRLKGGDILDLNIVKSAYGKSNDLKGFIEKSDVLYLDPNKNRTNAWLKAGRLQLPPATNSTYGSIGRITFDGKNVKIEGIPFKELLGTKKDIQSLLSHGRQLPEASRDDVFVTDIIPQTEEDVNRQYSMNESGAPDNTAKVAVEYISDKRKEMALQTMYGWENKKNHPTTESAEASPITSETRSGIGSFDNIIPQTEEDVNRQYSVREDGAEVLTENPERGKASLRQRTAENWDFFKRKVVDSGATIDRLGLELNEPQLYTDYNNVRHARGMGSAMIGGRWLDSRQHGAQYDFNMNKVGKSLDDIFRPVRDKGQAYTQDFFTYLLHEHNIDRMAQGKPVFSKFMTAEKSRNAADVLLKKHPEFAEMAKDVWKFNDNNLQYRVDAGLITQEAADAMRRMYPHYVPTYREQPTMRGGGNRDGRVRVNTGVKSASGSDMNILPIDEMMARQTMQMTNAAALNVFGNRLLDLANSGREGVGKYVSSIKTGGKEFDIDADPANERTMKNQFTVYQNGVPYTLTVSDGIFEGIDAVTPKYGEANVIAGPFAKANDAFKRGITSYNPLFLLTNSMKDIQDGALFSTNARRMLGRYPKAFAEIAGNGEMFQKYLAAGGIDSSFFNNAGNFRQQRNKLAEMTVDKLEFANLIVEQAPRLAEFMSVYETNVKNGVPEREAISRAIYAADDITTNFGRSGTWGRVLNRTAVPFLNAGIQGWDKLARTLTRSKSGRAWAGLAVKTAALSILPAILNNALYSDDDDYEHLDQYIRDNYYLYKLPDGRFLRLPKGRVLSLFGSATDRFIQWMNGDDKAFDGYIQNAASQVAPANPITNNLFSAFTQIASNRAWHGGEIENQQMQNIQDPAMRYDETTSEIAKAVGRALGMSPVQIDYLLDQYTGVFGDILLPLTTPAAEQNPVEKKFIADPAYASDYSDAFYNARDELEKTIQAEQRAIPENERIATEASLASKYLGTVSAQVSELYNEIDRLQADEYLDDATKLAGVRELREKINELQDDAVKRLPEIQEAIGKYYSLSGDGSLSEDELAEKYYIDPALSGEERASKIHSAQEKSAASAYAKAINDVFGADTAMNTYGKNAYEKAQNVVSGGGITMDQYFDYYTKFQDAQYTNADDTEKKQALLDMATDESGLAPMYAAMFEDNGTDERNTIAYAQEQGVRPSAFVEREIQKTEEHGMPGEPEEDAIWEDGKIVVDEHGTTESGTKKAQACANLLNSGYTEEEKEFFYQKQYSTDDNFPYYAAAGLPVDDYLSVKGYTATLKADKDENGKSIIGSKKQKLMDFLEGSDMSEEQKLFFFAQEYKVSGAEAQTVRDYINGLDTTDDVKEKLLASVKLGGGSSGSSSGGRRGSGRSGGSSKAASQAIPDSVWNTLRSNVKAPGVPDNPVFAALLSMAEEHDSIMQAAMERDIAAVEANPFISSEAKAAQKKKIRERYGKGAVS